MINNELLSQIQSIEVIEAGSEEETLEGLGSHPLDLVFMDIGLPGKSGLEVTKRIKADHPDTAITIFTSYNLLEYREATVKCGASCFIYKVSMKWDQISSMVKCFQRAKDIIGWKPKWYFNKT